MIKITERMKSGSAATHKKVALAVVSVVLVLLMGALAGCGGSDGGNNGGTEGENAGKYMNITAEEAYQRMNENPDSIVVDVRTEEEYNEKHIEGALLIPNENIGTEMPELLPDKDAEILIYCRSGNRSKEAAKKLIKMGYTNVLDFGGINDWTYETVAGPAQSGGSGSDAAGEADNGDPSFSNFTAVDIDGNEVDESIFQDYKLTMVNIWGTFCGPCIREMPDLGEINRAYDGKDFQIVGIVTDVLNQDLSVSTEMLGTAREIIDKTQADYLHLIPSEDLLYAGVASVRTIPFTFFVDKDGTIVGDTYSGSKSKSKWEKIIKDTLAEIK